MLKIGGREMLKSKKIKSCGGIDPPPPKKVGRYPRGLNIF